MELISSSGPLTFQVLQQRLITFVNSRIRNGDFTERGLAKILGISQPQIHNVLKGARRLRPELADRLIRKFEMSILDLLEASEIYEEMLSRGPVTVSSKSASSAIGDHVQPRRFGAASVAKKPVRAQQRAMKASASQAS